MSLELCLRYFHTVRYLKFEQVKGRIYRRIKKVDLSPVIAKETRTLKQAFVPVQLNKRSMFDHDQFVFLNETGTLFDWNDPQRSKLWLYNLHYFDDLNSQDASDRFDRHHELVNRWINENPPGVGNGWEAYPISLRVVNWIKWFLVHSNATDQQLESLALQAKVLYQTLETHLLGNHIFANSKALLFAGLYFKGAEADQWLARALKLLARELPEQILEDGGNFELSPMYHATMTADLLDILSLLCSYQDNRLLWLEEECKERLLEMLQWLAVMTHCDGYVSLFNDAAIDIAPTLAQLVVTAKTYEVTLPFVKQGTLMYLESSGYFRINLEEAALIGDIGHVGPDYIPGHAHADTLSFELSLFGQRLIVNSGTSVYGTSAERVRQRGTAAHSTVVIDGQNSSEVWGSFRVARRAKPFDVVIDKISNTVSCSHDGYKRLRGQPTHRRQWCYGKRSVRILDRVTGRFKSAEARYHLHPDWVSELAGSTLLCRFEDKVVEIIVKSGNARFEGSTYHPLFGTKNDNQVLVVTLNDGCAEVEISW
jgi:uncharacterized heparinase superfamily protein